MFQGLFTAMVTPFRAEGLDEGRLRANVDFQITGGVDGLVPVGTTGESPTLTHPEHNRVIEVVVKSAAGRVPVIAGAGSNSTAEALALARHAKGVGATATLQVVPYYNKPTQEGLYRHFMSVAEGVDLPMVLYNIPGRSGVALEPRTVARLAQHPNVAAIKEASGSMDVASEIASLCKITLLSGDDSLTLPLMGLGAKGVISVLSNLLPSRVRALVDAALKGDFIQARNVHQELLPLMKGMFLETNPIPIKTAMHLMNMDSGQLRLPLCEMSPENLARLQKILAQAGLLPAGKNK